MSLEKRHRLRPRLVTRAKSLRVNTTLPERLMWGELRKSKVKFRRQAPIGPFVVDFYCAAAQLVVEIDGMSHDDRATDDAERTLFLQAKGLHVLRLTNDEVVTNLAGVVDGVLIVASERVASLERPNPPPTPP